MYWNHTYFFQLSWKVFGYEAKLVNNLRQSADGRIPYSQHSTADFIETMKFIRMYIVYSF